jgi:hypothetical protein
MGKNKAGVRDGTGPYKGSYRSGKGMKGARISSGKKCPKK